MACTLQVVANEQVTGLNLNGVTYETGISLLHRQNLSVDLVLASATSSHIGTVPPVGNLLVVPNHLCRRHVHLHINRLTLVLEHDVEVGEANLPLEVYFSATTLSLASVLALAFIVLAFSTNGASA